jgi:hypothetical protein
MKRKRKGEKFGYKESKPTQNYPSMMASKSPLIDHTQIFQKPDLMKGFMQGMMMASGGNFNGMGGMVPPMNQMMGGAMNQNQNPMMGGAGAGGAGGNDMMQMMMQNMMKNMMKLNSKMAAGGTAGNSGSTQQVPQENTTNTIQPNITQASENSGMVAQPVNSNTEKPEEIKNELPAPAHVLAVEGSNTNAESKVDNDAAQKIAESEKAKTENSSKSSGMNPMQKMMYRMQKMMMAQSQNQSNPMGGNMMPAMGGNTNPMMANMMPAMGGNMNPMMANMMPAMGGNMNPMMANMMPAMGGNMMGSQPAQYNLPFALK